MGLEERVRTIISEQLLCDENEITNKSTFAELGGDSFDAIELIMRFEDEFNISISDEQVEKITTVGAAIRYLEEHVKNGSASKKAD